MAEPCDLDARGNVLAVVLAAGGGTRFAGSVHKLLAERDGRTVVEHAIAAAHEALGDVLVVTGAAPLPDAVTAMSGVRLVHNPNWADGQATSLGADGLDGDNIRAMLATIKAAGWTSLNQTTIER